MQTVLNSNWNWVDFFLHTSVNIFFFIGICLLLPFLIYGYVRVGLREGFTKKIDDDYFGNHSSLLKLVLLIIAFFIGIDSLFIEGKFFQYWNNVLLFFEITPK